MYFTEDQFTEKTTKLLIRLELSLINNIEAKKRDLKLYKSLEGGEELVRLTSEKLTQLNEDLQQLKNL